MIDYLKLLEQEPDFENYLKDILLKQILSNKQERDAVINTIYSFYQSGLSPEQVDTFVKNMLRSNFSEDE